MALIWCSNVVETCLYAGKLKEACQSIGFNKVRIQTDGLSDDFLSVFLYSLCVLLYFNFIILKG